MPDPIGKLTISFDARPTFLQGNKVIDLETVEKQQFEIRDKNGNPKKIEGFLSDSGVLFRLRSAGSDGKFRIEAYGTPEQLAKSNLRVRNGDITKARVGDDRYIKNTPFKARSAFEIDAMKLNTLDVFAMTHGMERRVNGEHGKGDSARSLAIGGNDDSNSQIKESDAELEAMRKDQEEFDSLSEDERMSLEEALDELVEQEKFDELSEEEKTSLEKELNELELDSLTQEEETGLEQELDEMVKQAADVSKLQKQADVVESGKNIGVGKEEAKQNPILAREKDEAKPDGQSIDQTFANARVAVERAKAAANAALKELAVSQPAPALEDKYGELDGISEMFGQADSDAAKYSSAAKRSALDSNSDIAIKPDNDKRDKELSASQPERQPRELPESGGGGVKAPPSSAPQVIARKDGGIKPAEQKLLHVFSEKAGEFTKHFDAATRKGPDGSRDVRQATIARNKADIFARAALRLTHGVKIQENDLNSRRAIFHNLFERGLISEDQKKIADKMIVFLEKFNKKA